MRGSDITRCDRCALHLLNDGKNDGAEFEIVEAPVAIGEEGTSLTIKSTNHTTFRFFLEPSVDVVIEQLRSLCLHLLIIASGNVEARGNLLVSDVRYDKFMSRIICEDVKNGYAVGVSVELERTSVGNEVLAIFTLTLKFSSELH